MPTVEQLGLFIVAIIGLVWWGFRRDRKEREK